MLVISAQMSPNGKFIIQTNYFIIQMKYTWHWLKKPIFLSNIRHYNEHDTLFENSTAKLDPFYKNEYTHEQIIPWGFKKKDHPSTINYPPSPCVYILCLKTKCMKNKNSCWPPFIIKLALASASDHKSVSHGIYNGFNTPWKSIKSSLLNVCITCLHISECSTRLRCCIFTSPYSAFSYLSGYTIKLCL